MRGGHLGQGVDGWVVMLVRCCAVLAGEVLPLGPSTSALALSVVAGKHGGALSVLLRAVELLLSVCPVYIKATQLRLCVSSGMCSLTITLVKHRTQRIAQRIMSRA